MSHINIIKVFLFSNLEKTDLALTEPYIIISDGKGSSNGYTRTLTWRDRDGILFIEKSILILLLFAKKNTLLHGECRRVNDYISTHYWYVLPMN